MKMFGLYACLLIGLLSTSLEAEENANTTSQKTIRLGAEDSWPPYSDKNGQGISTNLINAAFQKSGIKTVIQVRPYARVLQDIKAGALDGGYNVSRQKSNEADFVFGSQPLLRASAYWYFANPKGAGGYPHYRSLDRVPEGTRVGGIIDYEYGDLYESQRHKFKEIRVSRQSQLVRMLQLGRIDAAIMFEQEAQYTLLEMGLPEDVITKGFMNHTSDIYVAFSRKNNDSAALAKQLDDAITLMKDSGEYDRLLNDTKSTAAP